MRTPFLVVDAALVGVGEGDTVLLAEDQQHHLGRVLRRGDGDGVELTDGRGTIAVGQLTGGRVRLTAPPRTVERPRPAVTVVHGLPKARGLDEVVRTLTELGVDEVVPVVTERTESRPTGDRAARAVARWRHIARSAAEQAHSAHMLRVHDVMTTSVTLRERTPGDLALVADPDGPRTLGGAVGGAGAVDRVRLLVGPEGGLTGDELRDHDEAGWQRVRAGATVLRSVNAATVLVAAVMALSGCYGPARSGDVSDERSFGH